jgi:hypothetical protein
MDITEFFGPRSVPVVIFGTVLAVFELGDRLASQQAKNALSKWLLTFDVRKAGALPDGTKEIFERIFGERHFSLKCFVRSAAFSVGAIAFIDILFFLINPHPSAGFFIGSAQPWIIVGLWLLWNIVIDYASLFKTRLILGLLLQLHRRTMIIAIAILAMDYIAYNFIFEVGISLVLAIGRALSITEVLEDFISDLPLLLLAPMPGFSFNSIMYWAGFAPSLWMWLYVLALFVTRLLLRSEKLVNWLRWALDFEKNPFRSIGAVAATLAFIGSVVIILVSAEISWITKAVSG